ncbi:MAG: glycosyltransferase [Cyclobacteriaceae bacterium]|nr:glycosyltransferase [Cyclobacteriaceae bacterium]
MKVLFLIPYPVDEAPSQRFRFEQYFELLRSKGIEYHSVPYLNYSTWKILYHDGASVRKILGYLKGYLKRIKWLFRLGPYQWIFIHREITPLGPAWMVWWIAKIARKRIIYDFDDALWVKKRSSAHPGWSILKSTSKIKSLCQYSYRVSCGNPYLADFASKFNQNITVNPTTIDSQHYHLPQPANNSIPVIGWTGSHSTLEYLEPILPVLREMNGNFRFKLKIICNQPPDFDFDSMEYIPWNKENEIAELNTFDIGIMPLTDNAWTQGKCGFKILQYMALEKAAVASAVGVNKNIIEHGKDGLLCQSTADWITSLTLLLEDENRRTYLGQNARMKVITSYSVQSNQENFLSLFQD